MCSCSDCSDRLSGATSTLIRRIRLPFSRILNISQDEQNSFGVIIAEQASGIPSQELRESVQRYVSTRRQVIRSLEALDQEADFLFSNLRSYVRTKREEGVTDFRSILESYYSEVLDIERYGDRSVKSSLTRRFKGLVRKHSPSDPKYQKQLDTFV